MKTKLLITAAIVLFIFISRDAWCQQLPPTVKVSTQSIIALNSKVDSLSRVLSGSVLPGNQITSFLGALYNATSVINNEAQRSVKLYQDSLSKVKPVIKKP